MEEQDMSPLEYSSGCTSGWTMYLDQSFNKPTSLSGDEVVFPCKNGRFVEEEEEEATDLSMVSDASSGPPHLHYADDGHGHGFYIERDSWFCKKAALVSKGGKKRRAAEKAGGGEDGHSSLLADTASSHDLSFSKQCFDPNTNKMASSMEVEDVLDFSVGFSTTHFNGKSSLQKHCGFLDTSMPLKPTSKAKPRKKHEQNLW